tara:strand:- start:269 stop:460 length:192 start_codon:yes stop_codon:yes gene_type:complete
MGKITGHHFINRPPETLTRKQRKALKQSNKAGRTSQGYGNKIAIISNRSLILEEDRWAENLFV